MISGRGDNTVVPAEDALLGRMVGSYRLVRKLGQGGMGVVYLGEHPSIGAKVAIKFLHAQYSSDTGIVERFFNEARAVNLIGHGNIVKILDFSETEDRRRYCVMEFLEGRPLQALVFGSRALPLAIAGPIALQCCRALQAAHDRGIVHRDLKPDNVFLVTQGDRANVVKILDFGIAKLAEPGQQGHTQTGTVMGTPAYMSPEQAAGETSRIDARSDVYSLGVILFQLATGRVPFGADGASFGKIIVAHMQEPPPPPRSLVADIAPEHEGIILRALAKDPAQRFQSMAEIHEAIGSCLDALGIDRQPPLVEHIAPAAGPCEDAHPTALRDSPHGPATASRTTLPAATIPQRTAPPGKRIGTGPTTRLDQTAATIPLAAPPGKRRAPLVWVLAGTLGVGAAGIAVALRRTGPAPNASRAAAAAAQDEAPSHPPPVMRIDPPPATPAQPHADVAPVEAASAEPARPVPIPANVEQPPRRGQALDVRKTASLRTLAKPAPPGRGTKLKAEGLQLELPDQWESRQLSSGVALRPTGLPAGSRFALVVLPDTNVEGPFDEWFQSRWRALTSSYSIEGAPRVQRGKTRSGIDAAQMSADVHDPAGAVSFVLFWAAHSQGRVAMMVGRGSGPDVAKSLDAPIHQILKSADVER